MDAFTGPALDDLVTLVVPQRERVPARVEVSTATGVDLRLLRAIQMPWRRLVEQRLSVEFAGPDGLSRIAGHIAQRPQDAARQPVTASGERFRFDFHGNMQLLRRAALIAAAADARMLVVRDGEPAPAAPARCVAITGTSLRMAGLPSAGPSDVFLFDLFLEEQEEPLHGRFAVERLDDDGFVEGRLVEISGSDRSRLVQWAAEHGTRSVA